jgi:heat shock protein HtpX
VKRGKTSLIPSSGLADQTSIGLKETVVSPVSLDLKKQTKRDTGDIMMRVNNYLFLQCSCGLKIKIPPDYKKTELFCPRCGTKHSII